MKRVRVADLIAETGVKFGTSGARGLVSALTHEVAYVYTAAFLQHLQATGQLTAERAVALSGDLRPSTDGILLGVARAVLDLGFEVHHAGRIPSPAVALFGLTQGIPSIMVTGSHIPDDRNGIKFNSPKGEILKADEAGILAQLVEVPEHFDEHGRLRSPVPLPTSRPDAERNYVARYRQAFKAFGAPLRVGVYGHSAVGRELLVEVLQALGAEVIRLGWSERFVPVDTEAVRPEDLELARTWAARHQLRAIVSTDGDSDRPLLFDERGALIRGDTACLLAARYLGAQIVVAPVSCNTALERCGWFETRRTRIGSPFVIEEMQHAASGGQRVVGYEANGGFLQLSELELPSGQRLSSLPTRDAVIVHLALLFAAHERRLPLSELVAELPPRYTQSDRIAGVATEVSQAALSTLTNLGLGGMASQFADLGPLVGFDQVDGLRMEFASGEFVHLRPSGNAPELRVYVEAANLERSPALLTFALRRTEALLRRQQGAS